MAVVLGERFRIVTVNPSALNPLRHRATWLGLAGPLARTAAGEAPTLARTRDRRETHPRTGAAGCRPIELEGTSLLVPGCTSTTPTERSPALEAELALPVANSACAALELAEALVGIAVRHGERAHSRSPGLAAGPVRMG